jgi:hypothetical protein
MQDEIKSAVTALHNERSTINSHWNANNLKKHFIAKTNKNIYHISSQVQLQYLSLIITEKLFIFVATYVITAVLWNEHLIKYESLSLISLCNRL